MEWKEMHWEQIEVMEVRCHLFISEKYSGNSFEVEEDTDNMTAKKTDLESLTLNLQVSQHIESVPVCYS